MKSKESQAEPKPVYEGLSPRSLKTYREGKKNQSSSQEKELSRQDSLPINGKAPERSEYLWQM